MVVESRYMDDIQLSTSPSSASASLTLNLDAALSRSVGRSSANQRSR